MATCALALLPSQQFGRRVLADLEPLPEDAQQYLHADFDGDGLADLLTVGPVSGLLLHAARPDGRFVTGRSLPAGPLPAWSATALDFDGDGDLDLVVMDSNGVDALRNDGGLAFTSVGASILPAVAFVPDLAEPPIAVDLNQDGVRDLVVPSLDGPLTWMWTPSGRFADATASLLSAMPRPHRGLTAVRDFNGDGRNDLLHMTTDPARGDVLLIRVPGPGFVLHPTPNLRPAGAGRAQSLATADLDGDLDLDVLLVDGSQVRRFDNDGSGSFTERTGAAVPAGSTVRALLVGDLDLDGDVDAVLRTSDGPPQIWRNGPGSVFQLEGRAPESAYAPGQAMLLTDLDGRHGLDLLFQSNGPELWIDGPTGAGYLRAAGRAYQPAVEVRIHDAADVDGDGDLDFAGAREPLSGRAPAECVLGYGDGQGGVTWRTLSASRPGARMVFADVNGDGWPDLLGAVGGALDAPFPQPDLLFANIRGTGFLDVSTQLPAVSEGSNRLLPGDVDNDGDVDFVVIGTRPMLYRNSFGGVFTLGTTMPAATGIYTDGALGDFDGDGDLDVVAVIDDPFFPGQSQWRNDGSGGFTTVPGAVFPGAPRASRIAAGDLDGDGDLDVLLGAVGTDDAVYLNDGTGAFTRGAALPAQPTGACQQAWLVDLDEDGDLDALTLRVGGGTSRFGIALVALNGGAGNFSAPPAGTWFDGQLVGRRAVFADVDDDGDLDLAAESGMFLHHRRDLWMPRLARTGQAFPLRLRAFAPAPVTAAVVLQAAPPTAPLALPGLGTLRVDPTKTILVAPPGPVPGDGSPFDLALTIPLDPRILGVPLTAQAVFVEGTQLRLSGVTTRTVLF